jgi:glucosyl-3-phosphoglycerate synthase
LSYHVLRESQDRAAEALLKLVLERYRARSLEWMDRYEHVALLNGLHYDRAEEALAVTAFTEALKELTQSVAKDGLNAPKTRPSPAGALSAINGLGTQILAAAIR